MNQDAIDKIRRFVQAIARDDAARTVLSEALFESGFLVLPRVEFMKLPEAGDPGRLSRARTGILLDLETTGFDPEKDGIIQVSMLRFRYDDEGILSLGDMFDAYHDPGLPIPEEVMRLTGITEDMVRGQSIRDEDLADFIAGADLVVAHNAAFDRPFAEKAFPGAGFDRVGWHCSVEQVDWKARGASSAQLEGLARFCGFSYDAHNARSDILALAFVLAHQSDSHGSAFREMHARGVNSPVQVIAKGAAFEAKELLKARGYRWCPADQSIGGHSKVWHITVEGEQSLRDEAAFLQGIFGRPVILPALQHSPETRYSRRSGAAEVRIRTSVEEGMSHVLRATEESPSKDAVGMVRDFH